MANPPPLVLFCPSESGFHNDQVELRQEDGRKEYVVQYTGDLARRIRTALRPFETQPGAVDQAAAASSLPRSPSPKASQVGERCSLQLV